MWRLELSLCFHLFAETISSLRAQNLLPNAPVMPVGYQVAQDIMQAMAQQAHAVAAPKNFTGRAKNDYWVDW